MNELTRRRKPALAAGGIFRAWVVGAWYPATGISAAAWCLERIGQPSAGLCNAKASKGRHSDSWRATAGGFESLLESLPKGARIEVRCSNETAALLLRRLAEGGWKTEDLVLADGLTKVAAYDWWLGILKAGRSKKLAVMVIVEPANARRSAGIFRQLKVMARQAQERRARGEVEDEEVFLIGSVVGDGDEAD